MNRVYEYPIVFAILCLLIQYARLYIAFNMYESDQ